MEKKKSNIVIILLVLVVGIILGFGGYYVFNYTKTDKNIEKQPEQVEETKLSVTADDLEKMMSLIRVIPEYNGLTIEELSKIDNSSKTLIAMAITQKDLTKLKGKEVKQILVDNFGSDLNLELTDVLCDCHKKPLWEYDAESDSYVNKGGHGGNNNLYTYDFFVAVEVKDNIVSVKVQKIFEASTGDIIMPLVSYYTSYADAVNKTNKKTLSLDRVEEIDEDFEKLKQEIYESEKDILPIYTYRFENKNGKFLFKDYVIEAKK